MGAGNQIVQIFQGSQFITQQPAVSQNQAQHQHSAQGQSQQLQNRQTIISQSPQPQHIVSQPLHTSQHQHTQQQQFIQQIITSSPSANTSPSSSASMSVAGGTVIIGGHKQSKVHQQILPKPVTPSVSPSPGSAHQSPQQQMQPTFSPVSLSTSIHKPMMAQPKTTMVNHMPTQIQVTQTTTGGQFVTQAGQQQAQQGSAQQPQLVATPQTTPTATPTQAPTAAPQNGSSIILPTGNLNAQPLLLNQMPVIVQQNTPQGVQLILRPPTPQLAAPSLVIHNTRPQLQQAQPQQVLRILNTNGAMQLAAAPTFIVSSQGNLVQQNIPGLKTNQGVPLAQIQGLQGQRQPQQITAAINQHLLSQGVAQIQNLQLNGNLTQIQVPNGLNGQLLTTLPAQFQQGVGNFSLQNQNINLNQIGNANFSQIAAAAAASGATFTSPPPPTVQTSTHQGDIVNTQSIQFTTAQPVGSATQHSSQGQILGNSSVEGQLASHLQINTSVTPEPIRQPTPIMTTASGQQVFVTDSKGQQHQIQNQPQTQHYFSGSAIQQQPVQMQPVQQLQPKFETEKPKKERKSKKKKVTQPPIATAAPIIVTPSPMVTSQVPIISSSTISSTSNSMSYAEPMTSPPTSPTLTNTHTSTGKLDLANLMKISGIGIEDDDFMDTDEPPPVPPPPPLVQTTTNQQPPDYSNVVMQNESSVKEQLMSPPPAPLPPTTTDIMITIPASAAGSNVDFPYTISIPTSGLDGQDVQSKTSLSNDLQPKSLSSQQPLQLPPSQVLHQSGQEPPPFMITIDPSNDPNSAQPYTISIPRVSGGSPEETKMISVATVAPTPTAGTVSSSTSVITSSSQNTFCVNSLMNNVLNTQVTPNLQSQINEIQNQLIQAAASSVSLAPTSAPVISQSYMTTHPHTLISTSSITTPIVTTTITSPVTTSMIISPSKPSVTPSKKKSGGSKKNGKKLVDKTFETINTSVPTQIGNIQISQIDGTTVNNNKTTKGAINNQIQITPILDNKAPGHQFQGHMQSTNTVQINPTSIVQPTQPIQTIPNQASTLPQPVQQNSTLQPQHLQLPTAPPQIQQPSAQGILSQLTGALSLSLAENNHLILKHDINSPQDSQSQMILQAILSGALGNVSLVNEPSKPTPPSNPAPMVSQPAPVTAIQQPPKTIAAVSGQIQQKNVIVTNTQNHPNASGQFMPSFSPQSSSIVTSSSSTPIIQQPQQHQQPPQLVHQHHAIHTQPSHVTQSLKEVRKHESIPVEPPQPAPQPPPPQQTIVINSNAPKIVELPKIEPNQQLFSLNTLTNQITQLSPGQTTAALGPMERLLIVPTGINSQQLAQCLLQGQIHFNNIGPVTQSSDPKLHSAPPLPPQPPPMQQPIFQGQQQQQQQQLVIQNNPNFKPNQVPSTVPAVANKQVVNHQIKAEKPKRSRSKKSDKQPAKTSLVKVNPVSSGLPPNVILQPGQHAQPILAEDGTKIGTKIVGMVNPNNFVTNPVPTASAPPIAQVQPQQQIQIGTKITNNKTLTTSVVSAAGAIQCNNLIVTHASNAANGTTAINSSNLSISSNNSSSSSSSVNVCVQPNNVLSGSSLSTTSSKKGKVHPQPTTQSMMMNQMPPLVSVNSGSIPTTNSTIGAPSLVPRVQTIQLTPQKQQLLKNVQQQIQILSAKLQNVNLLSTLNIPADFDNNNPTYNKPLPILSNIQGMTDSEITLALQRLFIEQQKILATGKIIPTITTGHALPVPPPPTPIIGAPNSGGAVMSNDLKPHQAIVSPITVTPTSANAAVYQGGANIQTIPSPIQISSPQVVKQDTMIPTTSASNYASTIVTSSNSSMSITITNSLPIQQARGTQPKLSGTSGTSIIPISTALPPQTSVTITQAPQMVSPSIVKPNAKIAPPQHQIILNNKNITLTSTPSNIPMPSLVPTQPHHPQSMSVTKIELPPTPPPSLLSSQNRSNTPVPPPLVPTSMSINNQNKHFTGQSIVIVSGSQAILTNSLPQNVTGVGINSKTSIIPTSVGNVTVQPNPSLQFQLQQPQQPMNIVPPPLITMASAPAMAASSVITTTAGIQQASSSVMVTPVSTLPSTSASNNGISGPEQSVPCSSIPVPISCSVTSTSTTSSSFSSSTVTPSAPPIVTTTIPGNHKPVVVVARSSL